MKSYCHIIKHRWLDPLPSADDVAGGSNLNFSPESQSPISNHRQLESSNNHNWPNFNISYLTAQSHRPRLPPSIIIWSKNYDTSTATLRVGPINSDTLEIRSHQISSRPYIWHVLNNQPLISTWEIERRRRDRFFPHMGIIAQKSIHPI